MPNPNICNCSDNGKHVDVNYHSTYCQYAIVSAGQAAQQNAHTDPPLVLPSVQINKEGNVVVNFIPSTGGQVA